MSFLEFWKAWKEERRNTVECKECAMPFNAAKQAGVCPHIPIREFIYSGDIVRNLTRAINQDRIDVCSKDLIDLFDALERARKRAVLPKRMPPTYIRED